MGRVVVYCEVGSLQIPFAVPFDEITTLPLMAI